jgi:hypothetical protein
MRSKQALILITARKGRNRPGLGRTLAAKSIHYQSLPENP